MSKFKGLNGHTVGRDMKEMVRQAILAIRQERQNFETKPKLVNYKHDPNDFVTSADKAAQAIYVRLIIEGYPDYGIIAEEDNLSFPCQFTDVSCTFTVDPLDGTKAFIRRQSHGATTMIALVKDGQAIGAYVGDIHTQEMIGFRPESEKVHRIYDFDHGVSLEIDKDCSLRDQHLLLRDMPDKYAPIVGRITEAHFFKDIEVEGGSIGWWMSRLWTGKVGAGILRPGVQKPWDLAPIVGISLKLGFSFYEMAENSLIQLDTTIFNDEVLWRRAVLIVHQSRLDEINELRKLVKSA